MRRLQAPPLTPQAVAALAAESDVDAEALYARTGENPFSVAAVLAAGGDMPATVQDAVLARAARLPASSWPVLAAAATIGPTIDADLLHDVAAPAPEDLDASLGSGILEPHGRGFAFRHELAREAILGSIPPFTRRALHGQVLERLQAAPDEHRDPARLAHHAEGAGDAAAAMRYAPDTARRASRFRAHREAADQYARALRFADDLPAEQRARLFEAHGFECALTARIDQAMASREAAMAIWRERGDRRKEGEHRCHVALLHWTSARMVAAAAIRLGIVSQSE